MRHIISGEINVLLLDSYNGSLVVMSCHGRCPMQVIDGNIGDRQCYWRKQLCLIYIENVVCA
jgi:hypothetical protein